MAETTEAVGGVGAAERHRIVRIAAFDIGIKNFASAVIEVDLEHFYTASGTPRFRVIQLATHNILLYAQQPIVVKHKQSVLSVPMHQLTSALIDYMRHHSEMFRSCDYFVIEGQPNKEIKMTCLQTALHATLYGVYGAPQSRIAHMNSSEKYMLFKHGEAGLELPYPHAQSYQQTKKNSVALANYLMRMGATTHALVASTDSSQPVATASGFFDEAEFARMTPAQRAVAASAAVLTTHSLFDSQSKRGRKRKAVVSAAMTGTLDHMFAVPAKHSNTPAPAFDESVSGMLDLTKCDGGDDPGAPPLRDLPTSARAADSSSEDDYDDYVLAEPLPAEDLSEVFSVSGEYNKADDPADALGLAVARAVRLVQMELKQRRKDERVAKREAVKQAKDERRRQRELKAAAKQQAKQDAAATTANKPKRRRTTKKAAAATVALFECPAECPVELESPAESALLTK